MSQRMEKEIELETAYWGKVLLFLIFYYILDSK